MSGRIVLVGTPIGNLGDLSPRAVEALTGADLIVCEDTRRTRALLSHLGIPSGRRLRSLPSHDEAGRVAGFVEKAGAGRTVVLVTDAGMPGISDPGALLVRAALDAETTVELDAVPGPTALTMALVLSGLPTDRFVFEGFLPRKGKARRAVIDAIAGEPRTTVIYESPRRVAATLADLVAACGPARDAALARELTKLHQEVRRAGLGALAADAAAAEVRGECVIVVGPSTALAAEPDDEAVDTALRRAVAEGLSSRDAAARVAQELGIPKRAAYARSVDLSSG